jgi:N-acetylneuraminate lyase
MNRRELRGVLPAVVTPLDGSGNFQERPFERLLERLYGFGVHGLYLCGQAGEGLSQPMDQRKKVVETAIQLSPPEKLLIVQVGAICTSEAIALAEHAAKAGAHAVASLPPVGEMSFREIFLYYETLARASELPLLVYHHPGVCPLMTPELALELCSIPNVVGLKFTDLDLFGLSVIRQRGHIVFNGRDEILAAGLLMGANGGIGAFYNIVPEAIVAIYDLATSGRWTEAAHHQVSLNQLFRELLRFPLVPAIREVLAFSGLDCGESLAPRRNLTASERAAVREIAEHSPWLNHGAPVFER